MVVGCMVEARQGASPIHAVVSHATEPCNGNCHATKPCNGTVHATEPGNGEGCIAMNRVSFLTALFGKRS
jgi:hypothetical protein